MREANRSDSIVQASNEEDIKTYRWTGENDFCQLFANDMIAVGGGFMVAGGGGFDFVICDELKRGSSSPCKTYMAIDGNPCLVSDSEYGEFLLANIEIWALTPFLFEADAERSERSIRFRDGLSF